MMQGDHRMFGGTYGMTMQELKFEQMARAEQRMTGIA
jgi:hypothetical protein